MTSYNVPVKTKLKRLLSNESQVLRIISFDLSSFTVVHHASGMHARSMVAGQVVHYARLPSLYGHMPGHRTLTASSVGLKLSEIRAKYYLPYSLS